MGSFRVLSYSSHSEVLQGQAIVTRRLIRLGQLTMAAEVNTGVFRTLPYCLH